MKEVAGYCDVCAIHSSQTPIVRVHVESESYPGDWYVYTVCDEHIATVRGE